MSSRPADEMQVIEVVSPAPQQFKPSSTQFVKQSLKNYSSPDAIHCLVNTKKYSAYNKAPGVTKVIARSSLKFFDLTHESGTTVKQYFVGSFDSDVFGVVLSSGTADLYRVIELADGTLSANPTKLKFPEPVSLVEGLEGTPSTISVIAVTAQGKVYVADNCMTPEAAVPNVVGSVSPNVTVLRACRKMAAFGAAHGEVQLISIEGGRWTPLLAKPWFPHDEPTTATHIFSRRPMFATTDKDVRILTYSARGSELRLWNVAEKGAVKLLQTVTIKSPDGVASPPSERLFCIDAEETVLFLASAPRRVESPMTVVALSLDDGLCVVRGTEWTSAEHSGALAIGAVAAKVKTTSDSRMEKALMIRTTTDLHRAVFEGKHLEGSPNLLVGQTATGAAAPPAEKAVGKWFERAGVPTTSAVVDAAVLEGQLRDAAARSQNDAFASQMAHVKVGVMQLERLASGAASAIRTDATERIANESSRKTVKQIAEICRHAVGQSTPLSKVGSDANVPIRALVDAVRALGQKVAAETTAHHLRDKLPGFVERAWPTVTQNDAKEAPFPKPSQLPSTQAFCETIDRAHAQQGELFRRQKEQDTGKVKQIVTRSVNAAEASLAANRAYFARLQDSVKQLGVAVRQPLIVPRTTAVAAAAAPALSEDAIYAQAIKHAQSGRWKEALTVAVEAGKASLLLRFLETELIKTNRAQLTQESRVSIPVMVALLQQLSSDLRASLGAVPCRVEWMLELLTANDSLVDVATASPQDAQLIHASDIAFSNILDAVNVIDEKTEVDTVTRRKLRVLKKALETLAAS